MKELGSLSPEQVSQILDFLIENDEIFAFEFIHKDDISKHEKCFCFILNEECTISDIERYVGTIEIDTKLINSPLALVFGGRTLYI